MAAPPPPSPDMFNTVDDPTVRKIAGVPEPAQAPPAPEPADAALLEALKRKEVSGESPDMFPAAGASQAGHRPGAPPRVDPGRAGEAGLYGGAARQFVPADQYEPIRVMGESRSFIVVIPDNRPTLAVPLAGPGAYEITITRKQ